MDVRNAVTPWISIDAYIDVMSKEQFVDVKSEGDISSVEYMNIHM